MAQLAAEIAKVVTIFCLQISARDAEPGGTAPREQPRLMSRRSTTTVQHLERGSGARVAGHATQTDKTDVAQAEGMTGRDPWFQGHAS